VNNSEGSSYFDWRTTKLTAGTPPSSHNNLANLQSAGTGVTWGHVDDQAQSIYGIKTFSDGLKVFSGAATIGQIVAEQIARTGLPDRYGGVTGIRMLSETGGGLTSYGGMYYKEIIGTGVRAGKLYLLSNSENAPNWATGNIPICGLVINGNIVEIPTTPTVDSANMPILVRNSTTGAIEQIAKNTLQPADADLTAIAAISETLGLLKKTAANTWVLDTSAYLTSISKANVEAVLTGEITTHTHALNLSTTSIASDTTPNPIGSSRENEYFLTALDGNITEVAAPSGTLANGNTLLMRIKDNGTARTIAWNAVYKGFAVSLPSTTIANKEMYLGFIYNSATSKWDLVSKVDEL
jgi:hypothetical protein